MNNTLFQDINSLIINPSKTFTALHGTSIYFLEKLLKNNGEINGQGNFGNEFYVLQKNATASDADVLESATYYANVNAIKDSLFHTHLNIFETISKVKLDPYLFLVGIGDLTRDTSKLPFGFDVFSPSEMNAITTDIAQAKSEDRKGVIIFFSEELSKHFELETDPISFQVKINLSKPIPLDHICAIHLLGKYEKERWEKKGKE